MALGDDFDGETIKAYQLADFSGSCQLPRSYLVKQLKSMSFSLLSALGKINMLNITSDDEEKHYLKQYKKMIKKRCEYFLLHADEIMSVKI